MSAPRQGPLRYRREADGLRRLGAPGRRPAASGCVRRLGGRPHRRGRPGPRRSTFRRRADPAGARQRPLAHRVRGVRRLRRRRARSAAGSRRTSRGSGALDQDAMVAIARLGAAELLAAGVTTTADYSFSGAAAPPPPSSACGRPSIWRCSAQTPTRPPGASRASARRSTRTTSSGSASRPTRRTPALPRSTATASRSAFRSARTSPRATARTSGCSTAPGPLPRRATC